MIAQWVDVFSFLDHPIDEPANDLIAGYALALRDRIQCPVLPNAKPDGSRKEFFVGVVYRIHSFPFVLLLAAPWGRDATPERFSHSSSVRIFKN